MRTERQWVAFMREHSQTAVMGRCGHEGPPGCVLTHVPSVSVADPPAQPQHSPSHGYDDVMAVLEVSPSPQPADAPAQPPEDMGYDDVGVCTLGTSL